MTDPVDYYVAGIAYGLELLYNERETENKSYTISLNLICNQCTEVFGDISIHNLGNNTLLLKAVERLSADGLIIYLPDRFADDLIQITDIELLFIQLPEINEPYKRMLLLNEHGASWLFGALSNINSKNHENTHNSDLSNLSLDQGHWQPLQLDRNSPEYEKSIEAAENALKEIEGNNGYASTEPDERNAMVHTIRGAINALKDGTPSLEQVKAGLLKPLQYLSKKFADSAIGAAAKSAVAELIKWLL